MFLFDFKKKILSTKCSFEKRRMLIENKPSILRSPTFWNEFLLSDEKVKKEVIKIASKVSKSFSKYSWVFEDDALLEKILFCRVSNLLFLEANIDRTPQKNIQKWKEIFETDVDDVRKYLSSKMSVTEDEFKKILEEIPIDLF